MVSNVGRAKYEMSLGAARSALTRAYNNACALGDDGAQEDLMQMILHCGTLIHDSFRGSGRGKIRAEPIVGQMTVEDVLRASRRS